jgi:hypothetical protein
LLENRITDGGDIVGLTYQPIVLYLQKYSVELISAGGSAGHKVMVQLEGLGQFKHTQIRIAKENYMEE